MKQVILESKAAGFDIPIAITCPGLREEVCDPPDTGLATIAQDEETDEEQGKDPQFEEGSMEANLLLRLKSRWELHKAHEKFEAEFYDWSYPDRLPLAEAIRETQLSLGRTVNMPQLSIPPLSPKATARSARSARAAKDAHLPLPSPMSSRSTTVATSPASWTAQGAASHAHTASDSLRFRRVPRDVWPLKPVRSTKSTMDVLRATYPGTSAINGHNKHTSLAQEILPLRFLDRPERQ
jgi:hypothetical protein